MTTLITLATLAAVQPGQPAPDFQLPTVDGSTVKLSDHRGKIVVLEWFNPGCPYVKYAHGDGPLASLAATHAAEGIVWIAVNSGAPGKQGYGLEVNQTAAQQWSMSHPIAIDESGKVGKLYGAKTTPQMFVIDPAGVVKYAGALDNAPMGEVSQGATYRNHVDAALASVQAGQPVQNERTNPYGCSVKY